MHCSHGRTNQIRYWLSSPLVGGVQGMGRAAAPPSGGEIRQGPVLLLLMIRVEALLLGAERPGEVEQFPRGGTACDFHRLAGRAQALVERPDRGVVAGGAERRHVQRGPQSCVAVMADAGAAADAA